MIKPRIRSSYYGGGWVCVSKGCIGCGATPCKAYDSWMVAFNKWYGASSL